MVGLFRDLVRPPLGRGGVSLLQVGVFCLPTAIITAFLHYNYTMHIIFRWWGGNTNSEVSTSFSFYSQFICLVRPPLSGPLFLIKQASDFINITHLCHIEGNIQFVRGLVYI